MPKTKKFLTLAVATAIAGTTMLGVTSATSDYIHEQDGTISICDPASNGEKCITMQDKNLGATKTGTGCSAADTGACGDHFQWGNNHGFEIGCRTNGCSDTVTNSATGTLAIWSGNYNHVGYNGATFIKGTSSSIWDYWSDNRPSNHNGLRGGENDTAENNYGFDGENNKATNVENRQGPCEDGYHVPSIGEWNKVLEYWAEENGIELEDDGGLKYNNTTLDGLKFQEDFKIPFAGDRNGGAKVYDIGNYANLWSSSPYVGKYQARRFYLNQYEASAGANIYRADAYSLRCFKDEPLKFLPLIESIDSDIQVTIGNETYDDLSEIMEVTTNNEVEVEADEPVVGEVSVDFGENVSAKFNKLVQVNIPVSDYEDVIVKVKHEGSSEYNFDGLTLNRNASCNDNGRPTSSQYNGEIISVVDGFASIYTCEASSFVALGVRPGEALGEVTLTLTAGENTCTLNDYNLGTHNVSSEDQNVSTSGQDIVCEFLKNTRATIQLSMGDLVDGTKEIGRQYFTGIVSPLGNPLGTIANLTGGSYNFSGSHIIYTKQANTIGTWTGSLAIEGIIPAGTPSGEYTGELNVIICEGC